MEQPDLASGFSALLDGQADALENQAWNGTYYDRAYVDSGNRLADGVIYLSAQVLPILAGVVDVDRRNALPLDYKPDDLIELPKDFRYESELTYPLRADANGKADYSWECELKDESGEVVAISQNLYQMRRIE